MVLELSRLIITQFFVLSPAGLHSICFVLCTHCVRACVRMCEELRHWEEAPEDFMLDTHRISKEHNGVFALNTPLNL